VTIGFRLPPAAAERVAFSYSPAMEAVLSLHVLVEPKHHPVQHEWVRAMRRLSPALKREIDTLAFVYRAYFPEFFFPPPAGELSDFAAELRRLRGFDEHLVRLEFAIALLEAQAAEGITRDPAALDHLAEVTYEHFGEVRLLINNAGIEALGFTWELSAEQWNRVIDINVLGVIHGVRAFAGRMVAAGKPAFISNVSSIGGLSMMPVQTPYILSKHAVLSFSECLYLEMKQAQAPIRVAITGRIVGPPLFESLELLGRDETVSRLDAAIARLA